MTVDTLDPTSASSAPPPTPPGPSSPARRSFARRHPWLTALYSMLGLIGLLLLALAIFLWLANWNMLRGPIGRYVSAQTHRHVELDGDLKVHLLTFTPTVSIGDLKISNPDWAGPGDTADVGRIVVSVRLWPLLTGRLVLPLLEFDKPVLTLLRDKTGRQNWDLGASPKSSSKPFKIPPIEQFIVNDGHLSFNDPARGIHLSSVIDSNEKAAGSGAHAFSLVGDGSINRNPFAIKLSGGPLLHIKLDQPYSFTSDVRAGDAHLTADGQLVKPFDLANFTANLSMSGRDLFNLYAITGLALPNTPPYAIRGVLTRKGREFDFNKAAGRIGGSDIEGDMKVEVSQDNRPTVDATMRSRTLDFKDLATLFGAPPVGKGKSAATPKGAIGKVTAAATPAETRLLPDATLATDRLSSMDATLNYHAESVKTQFVPISAASLALRLDHGLLTIDPVAFNFPQGRLWAQIHLNARSAVPVTDADVRLSNVNLQEFTPHKAGSPPPIEGILAARVKLTGRGDSVHKAAASSNGAVTAVIPSGKVRRAFAELLGVNAGKGLSLLLSKNKDETDIRCAVADFTVSNGVLHAQNVVFDTDVVKVNGKGDIDLGPESIDLTLKGDTKRFSWTHLLVPITIKGHLRSPALGIQPAPLVAQAGAAVALGTVLTPLAAILPFVDPGLAKNADCAGLMTTVETAAAPVSKSQAHGLVTHQ